MIQNQLTVQFDHEVCHEAPPNDSLADHTADTGKVLLWQTGKRVEVNLLLRVPHGIHPERPKAWVYLEWLYYFSDLASG